MSDSKSTSSEDNTLIIAVVQAQDSETAQSTLAELGMSVTRLPSVGGFLGRRNATLLVGLQSTMQPEALKALNESCRQRVEYIAVPLESAPLPLPTPMPVVIGGATIFSLEIEHYEEI
jgi:uncharacterized protein YaaQ